MSPRLEDEIEASAVAAEIVMLRAASNRAILLVEGPSDANFFFHFVNQETCEIVIAYGKGNVIGALTLVRAKTMDGVVCVIDADFQPFVGPPASDKDVLLTDDHDLEIMLFRSPAFEKVLTEYGSARKVRDFRKTAGGAREIIIRSAHPLGIFRLYSLEHNVHLRFRELKYTFVDRKTLKVDIDAMILVVHNHSMLRLIDDKPIKAFINKWLNTDHDPWQMCCGHDLIEIFAKALQSYLGSRRAIEVDYANVERALRLAYSFDNFSQSNLFSAIRSWEERNRPYICLRSPIA